MPSPPRRITKTYLAVTGPNASTAPVVPSNPQRVALLVQNTGAGPGQLRFGAPVQGNGSDITVIAGAILKWDQSDTAPQDSVNLSSAAAASWCIIETVWPQ